MTLFFICTCILIFLFLIIKSPFPYYKTYFILWKTVLLQKNDAINSKARIYQVRFLLKYIFLCPLYTIFWYLDEFFYPNYKWKEIHPIFIIGQPRSGTTFLHRTLAKDTENFLAIKHIEWRYPFITLQKIFLYFPFFKKLIEKNYWSNSSAGKTASKMHPNKLSDWEEDGIFYEECFLHHFFIFLRFPYPNLLKYLDDFPALPPSYQQHIINTHKKVIQKIMFLRGGQTFYLSKEATSHNKFATISRLYPDAKFILSCRYSSDFMSSLLALVRASTQSKTGIDPVTIPGWEAAFVDRMQKDSDALVSLSQDVLQEHEQIAVLFDSFTNDLVQSIEYVYAKLNLPISETYRQHISELALSQKTRDKGYDYEKKTIEGFEKFDAFVKAVAEQTHGT